MGYFASSGITGCISPSSASTNIMFNDEFITTYYKKDVVQNFISIYMVNCVFDNNIQQFQFLSTSDRDTFYSTLPITSYIVLSGITGCMTSGGTVPTAYDVMFNSALINTYYKKDITENFINIFMVIIVFDKHIQQFKFLLESDRDTFYGTLP